MVARLLLAFVSAAACAVRPFPAARQNPGKISYGTTGVGSAYHMAGELLQLLTGVEMVHVPYKAGPQSITDLVAGRIQVAFSVYATTVPFVSAGKIRNLAVINDRRFARIPLNVIAGGPQEFAATMRSNVERLAKMMKAAGIEPE